MRYTQCDRCGTIINLPSATTESAGVPGTGVVAVGYISQLPSRDGKFISTREYDLCNTCIGDVVQFICGTTAPSRGPGQPS